MKNLRKQTISPTILILLLSIATFVALVPSANAAVIEIETHSYIILAPESVGVGQDVVVTYRLDKVAAGATIRAGLFNGTSVTITRPDGTVETKSSLSMDSTSAGWFVFVPTVVGTYTLQMNFPAQWINGTVSSGPAAGINAERLYKASTSARVSLVVQQNPIQGIPDNPLPTGYWTRPINAENKGWWQIADNWLMLSYDINSRPFYWGTAFAPYTPAPKTPHVLWKEPIWYGGIVGGRYGDRAYYTGLSYEQLYTPLILNGRIIYTDHGPTGTAAFGTRILDLYTGKEVMYLNNTVINFAQTLLIDTGNEHGVLPYLWSVSGQNWLMYDAYTGRQILNVTGMPTASAAGTRIGPNGELLVYVLSTTQNTLTMWNSTRAIGGAATFDTWSPALGSTINASRPLSTNAATANTLGNLSNSILMGVEWNVTIPDIPGSQSIQAVGEGYLLAQWRDTTSFPYVYVDVAYDIASIKRGFDGAYPTSINHMWTRNRTDVYSAFYRAPWNIENGVYVLHDEGKMQVHGYNIRTGDRLWKTEPLTSGLGIFDYQIHLAYGRLYTAGFDGYVRAYNSTTGQLIWKYYFGNAGYETPYGTWPVYNGFTIADHKLYITNDEHSPDSVMWRGGKLTCINADTGDGIWNMSGWMRMPAIADGILTSLNVLDGQVYTLGKGPSAVTVSAPPTLIPKGTGVMITGTVTDQSPGQKDTACISDGSMASWMEYLHMQKPLPVDTIGVPVKLTAIDPNGNSEVIGTVVSDISGVYGIIWTPTLEGKYQIKATFEGTDSYGSSFSITYLGVGPAPAVPEPTATPTATPQPTVAPTATPTPSPSVVPEPEATPSTDIYIIAAAAVIIVVVAAAAIIFRRRK